MAVPDRKSIITGLIFILVIAGTGTLYIIYSANLRSGQAAGHLSRGIGYIKNGKNIEAVTELEKAISIKPGLWKAYYYLGGIYLKKNMLSEAGKEFAKALKLKPAMPEIYNALGIVYFKMGKVDAATAYFQASLRLNPLNEQVNAILETINGRGMKQTKK